MKFVKATFQELAKKPAAFNITHQEAALLPQGSLFCDKKGKWLVTTKLSPAQITERITQLSWRYSKKLAGLIEMVGKHNVLAVRYAGHRKSWWTTERELGEVPKLPMLLGSYHTHSNGWGDEFSCSTVKQGEIFEHEGESYCCVYQKYVRGSAEYFSTTSVLAVKL
jgi:hypothetical protein